MGDDSPGDDLLAGGIIIAAELEHLEILVYPKYCVPGNLRERIKRHHGRIAAVVCNVLGKAFHQHWRIHKIPGAGTKFQVELIGGRATSAVLIYNDPVTATGNVKLENLLHISPIALLDSSPS